MIELSNNMDFEEAYAALKEAVAALEASKDKIEDTIALYEKACRLVVYCQRKLNDTKSRIVDINERIRELRANGEPLFEDGGE